MVGVWDRVTLYVHNYNKPPAIVVLRGQWGKDIKDGESRAAEPGKLYISMLRTLMIVSNANTTTLYLSPERS